MISEVALFRSIPRVPQVRDNNGGRFWDSGASPTGRHVLPAGGFDQFLAVRGTVDYGRWLGVNRLVKALFKGNTVH